MSDIMPNIELEEILEKLETLEEKVADLEEEVDRLKHKSGFSTKRLHSRKRG